MDLSNNSTVKTPEAETETPTRIQPVVKTSPFTNGVLKRHAPLHLHHHPVVVTYRECLKNHAAALGGLAVDGCGEFMPSPTTNPADPTSLKCAACGCHRNFHRREPEEPALLLPTPPNAAPALEYRPHHRHHPPPPPRGGSPNNSPSPPPISSSYYPSAPHMLLALSHGLSAPPPDSTTPISGGGGGSFSNSGSRKRFRTKFTQDQKDKMLEFAEKVGWKMQKREEDSISEFCSEIGVDKGVFKVWMHNNKNTFGKKDNNNHELNLSNTAPTISTPPPTAANGGSMIFGAASGEGHYHHHQLEEEENNDDSKENVDHGQDQLSHHNHHHDNSNSAQIIGTNGSSSSF